MPAHRGKIISLFSVFLLLAAFAPTSNAFADTRVSVTQTGGGGIVVSNEVDARGGESATAEVRNVIRSNGENARVRIDIRAEADGVSQTKTIESASPARETAEEEEAVEVEIATSSPRSGADMFERLEALFTALFSRIFGFWR